LKQHKKVFHKIHKNGLDKFAYVIIGVTLLVGFPQVYQIWTTQSAEDVSLLSWIGYSGIALFWLWFGLERKVKPIIISSLAYLLIDVSVVVGILQFGNIQL
jgi:uncharacterized protein with PQ loop repeat